MKKSCLIAAGLSALLVIAVIVGAGGWLVWSRFVRPGIAPATERAKSTMRETGRRSELPGVEMRVYSAAEGRASTGWPLLVRVFVRCPVSADTHEPKPVTITGPSGSWHESLRLVVQDSNGETVDWPWQKPAADGGPVTLDGQTGLDWIWWLTGPETQNIRPGKYKLAVVLDTTAVTAEGAWKGTVGSRPAVLDFRAPGQLSPDQEALREIQTARIEALSGNSAAAVTRLKSLIGRSPKNIEALSFCASLLADSGRLDDALPMYNQAIEEWYSAHPGADGEPRRLLQERRRVRNRLLAQEP